MAVSQQLSSGITYKAAAKKFKSLSYFKWEFGWLIDSVEMTSEIQA